MRTDYDAIVIGSGLGGLTAGALYARAGHKVLVLERNQAFGGAATTYRHGGLTIEAALHETADPDDPHEPKARILRALGIRDRLDFVPVGDFYQVRGGPFETPFTMPHGLVAAEAALGERFPNHPLAFRRLFQRVRGVLDAVSLVGEEHDSLWWFLHAPSLPLKFWPLLRDARLSLADVLDEHFGDDEGPKLALAANLPYYADDPVRLWWISYALAQGGLIGAGGTFIRGGSHNLSEALVRVITEEGGTALPGRTVTDIAVDDQGRAAGVRHRGADGGDVQTVTATVLFGNAAPTVLAEALPASVRDRFSTHYAGRSLSISLFSAAIGLDRPPAEVGVSHYATMLLPDWMRRLADYAKCAALLADGPGERMPALAIVDYGAADSGLNPDCPRLVSVVGVDRLANWEGLDLDAYAAKRDAWLDAIIAHLDRAFPGFGAAVVHKELSTAAAMHRTLNTPGGAIYGFAPSPPAGLISAGVEHNVATPVDGLWLASAFGGFGGFTGAMMTGALAARAALHARRRTG